MDDQRLPGAPLLTGKAPQYSAAEIATAWELQKRSRRATCRVVLHRLGVELRAEVDGDVIRTEVVRQQPRGGRVPMAAVMLAAKWRERWMAKGWKAPAPQS